MDEDKFDVDYENYNINYDNVMKSKDLLAVTRLTAANLMKCPYTTLGDFFKGLTDSDIQSLQDIVELLVDEPEDEIVSNLIILTEMLTSAEGVPRPDLEDMHKRLNSFCMYVTVVSLARKGFVKVYYENMSFGEDMGKKIVVERID
jgi:hypothetical protein